MRAWTPEEKHFLKENYGIIPTKTIAEKLNRTISSVHNATYNLGLRLRRYTPHKPWREKETDFLAQNYGKIPTSKIAEKLGRTVSAVHKMAEYLNLEHPYCWSDEELNTLKENYGRDSLRKLAKKLGRSEKAVYEQARLVGMVRENYSKPILSLRLKEREKGYLAGMIDGEGCISIGKDSKRGILGPIVSIANTDIGFLKALHRELGGSIYRGKDRVSQWYIQRIADILYFLETVKPLKVKKQQADLMIEFCRSRLNAFSKPYTQREMEIYELLSELNGRKGGS